MSVSFQTQQNIHIRELATVISGPVLVQYVNAQKFHT
jgi:hypothetical protein